MTKYMMLPLTEIASYWFRFSSIVCSMSSDRSKLSAISLLLILELLSDCMRSVLSRIVS
jgi:hypothetical protein